MSYFEVIVASVLLVLLLSSIAIDIIKAIKKYIESKSLISKRDFKVKVKFP